MKRKDFVCYVILVLSRLRFYAFILLNYGSFRTGIWILAITFFLMITSYNILRNPLNHTCPPCQYLCITIMTSDVSHLTCWCWAAPDSATGQRVPALQRPLGGHVWRSCGRTVERRWSPHRSPPHPSLLTHLTIAGPGTHGNTHFTRSKGAHTISFVKMTETQRFRAVCPK